MQRIQHGLLGFKCGDDMLISQDIEHVKTQLDRLGISYKTYQAMLETLPDVSVYQAMYEQYCKLIKCSATFDKFLVGDRLDFSQYPIEAVSRMGTILYNNKELIKDRRVLDFSCNVGYMSYIALHYGAAYVKLRDIYPFKLEIAEQCLNASIYTNFDTAVADIFSNDDLADSFQDTDTALFLGIFSHIVNQETVIKCLSASKVTAVIVDGPLPPILYNNRDLPLAVLIEEDSLDDIDILNTNRENKYNLGLCTTEPYLTKLFCYHGWTMKRCSYYKVKLHRAQLNNRFCVSYVR